MGRLAGGMYRVQQAACFGVRHWRQRIDRSSLYSFFEVRQDNRGEKARNVKHGEGQEDADRSLLEANVLQQVLFDSEKLLNSADIYPDSPRMGAEEEEEDVSPPCTASTAARTPNQGFRVHVWQSSFLALKLNPLAACILRHRRRVAYVAHTTRKSRGGVLPRGDGTSAVVVRLGGDGCWMGPRRKSGFPISEDRRRKWARLKLRVRLRVRRGQPANPDTCWMGEKKQKQKQKQKQKRIWI
ncbi:hypothetical protein K438DRAFT_1770989 [Mycena galopus ATCC 62051]|nr:hypothetical protein K438DRAFT_1770989 [Mycena galopus ATCC 62051]